MSKICGWLDRAAGMAQTDTLIAAMAQRLGGRPGAQVASAQLDGAAVASLAVGNEALIVREGSVLIALAGAPAWTDAGHQARARDTGMAQSLVHAWRSHGSGFLAQLGGRFALALIDTQSADALLAIDRIGQHELCYALRGPLLAFAATADAITQHPAIPADIDPQALYDYLYCHMVPAPATIYREVHKLLPAQYLELRGGRADTGFYWSMPYEDHAPDDYARYAAQFVDLVQQSVRDCQDTRPLGAFLSGGTDSSTVAGMLARLNGTGPDTYSIGFEAEGFDEMEFARITATQFGCRAHEYYVTPSDVAAAIPRIAAIYDEPFGNASAVPTYFCALRAREDGRELMLAGDGGDEIFGGNARYADQAVFEHYSRVPGWVRAPLEGALGMLPEVLAVGVLRKARNYVSRARIALPDRLEIFNHVEREGAASLLPASLLRGIDADRPRRIAREVYARTRSGAMVNRMMHLDLKQTLADSDLRKVSRMCELAGVAVRYPLLDDRLLEFSAMLPENYKVRDGQLRWFFKKALSDFLPQATLTKSKHGFGLPFGMWMKQDPTLTGMALDALDALVQRRLIRPEFVSHLLARHREDHASYYGVMIWVLLMLEYWLRAHPQARLDA